MLRIGSLCSGAGGLDLATSAVFDAEVAWHAEVDPAACRVLAERFPGVPNFGDITALDWSAVPPVDVITAGYPCQPFSYAGQRKGSTDARHLWPAVAEAIRVLRPGHVVLENVPGHLSLGFDTVLGDLAACGFDAEWTVLAASDVEAAHRRRRLFVYAWSAADASRLAERKSADEANSLAGERDPWPESGDGGLSDRGQERESSQALSDSADDRCQRGWVARRGWSGSADGDQSTDWGPYGAAVRRWESVIQYPAPDPTEAGPTGHRLSPRFVEWLMALADGWVTAVPGLSRSAQLRILGNGVVPLQAESALGELVRRR